MRRLLWIMTLPAQMPHVPELSSRRRCWLAMAPLTAPTVRMPELMPVKIIDNVSYFTTSAFKRKACYGMCSVSLANSRPAEMSARDARNDLLRRRRRGTSVASHRSRQWPGRRACARQRAADVDAHGGVCPVQVALGGLAPLLLLQVSAALILSGLAICVSSRFVDSCQLNIPMIAQVRAAIACASEWHSACNCATRGRLHIHGEQMLISRRAYLGRHYTDLVLVAVVALCTQENDVIHAGYLALALLFFRRRDALRTERNRCLR